MAQLPDEALAAIRAGRIDLSVHADESVDRYEYCAEDIIAIADSAGSCKKERDPKGVSRYVYSMIGRDTRGRRTYMAGKLVPASEPYWYVVTIHPAA